MGFVSYEDKIWKIIVGDTKNIMICTVINGKYMEKFVELNKVTRINVDLSVQFKLNKVLKKAIKYMIGKYEVAIGKMIKTLNRKDGTLLKLPTYEVNGKKYSYAQDSKETMENVKTLSITVCNIKTVIDTTKNSVKSVDYIAKNNIFMFLRKLIMRIKQTNAAAKILEKSNEATDEPNKKKRKVV